MANVSGTIPADCRLPIRCTVKPACRAHYCWTISYHILNASGSVQRKQCLCRVYALNCDSSVYMTLDHSATPYLLQHSSTISHH